MEERRIQCRTEAIFFAAHDADNDLGRGQRVNSLDMRGGSFRY